MKFTRQNLRTLDVTNYMINTEDEQYYLTDGRRSLKRFAKRHGLNRRTVYEILLVKRQIVLQNESITAI